MQSLFFYKFPNFLRPLNSLAPSSSPIAPLLFRVSSSSSLSSVARTLGFCRKPSTARLPASLRSLGGGNFPPAGGVVPLAGAMGVAGDEGSPAKRFWGKCCRESLFAMYSPFLVGLASGTLEMESFQHYVAQDVHFLRTFVRAYEMAEECADDDDAKASICELRDAVVEELKMHNSFAEAWGVKLLEESAPNSATAKYTDFLLATAAGKVEGGKVPSKIATPFEKTKVAAYTVGAMTPCMRLYAFLGREVQQVLDPEDHSHPYRKWVENYASESFEASARQTEELLDKLSVSLTGEELEVIERLYHQAMELEIEFFHSPPMSHRSLVPFSRIHDSAKQQFIVFSDFDLTCTTIDSSAVLAELAILTAPKVEPSEPDNLNFRKLAADLKKSWDALSQQYAEEYEQCIEDMMLVKEGEVTSFESLYEALEQLSAFEKRANLRVIESEVLKGLNLECIKRAGENLRLQDGCAKFFQQLVQKKDELNADIHILSYCWCRDLIQSAFKSGGLEVLNIHANEFIYEESISTGKIDTKVESPTDKLQVFKDALKHSGDDDKHSSVYIGDSVGDLLCLLEADVGIVVGSSPSLRSLGERFGVSFVPLFPAVVKRQREFVGGSSSKCEWPKGVLYTVSSWNEIQAFILG
ncbi:putative aminopyrimidine aminohydrolase [Nymphaea thermarum]|nr:putative aminopyrimidine aminohydrolase [Nymphaea thermarum]